MLENIVFTSTSGVSQDPNFGALVILKICNKINVEIILFH